MKVDEIKREQNYRMTLNSCGNCKHYSCVKKEKQGAFGGFYIEESKKRCEIGGFAVKKTATCDLWEKK